MLPASYAVIVIMKIISCCWTHESIKLEGKREKGKCFKKILENRLIPCFFASYINLGAGSKGARGI